MPKRLALGRLSRRKHRLAAITSEAVGHLTTSRSHYATATCLICCRVISFFGIGLTGSGPQIGSVTMRGVNRLGVKVNETLFN